MKSKTREFQTQTKRAINVREGYQFLSKTPKSEQSIENKVEFRKTVKRCNKRILLLRQKKLWKIGPIGDLRKFLRYPYTTLINQTSRLPTIKFP